jgi:hypothetical protein
MPIQDQSHVFPIFVRQHAYGSTISNIKKIHQLGESVRIFPKLFRAMTEPKQYAALVEAFREVATWTVVVNEHIEPCASVIRANFPKLFHPDNTVKAVNPFALTRGAWSVADDNYALNKITHRKIL